MLYCFISYLNFLIDNSSYSSWKTFLVLSISGQFDVTYHYALWAENATHHPSTLSLWCVFIADKKVRREKNISYFIFLISILITCRIHNSIVRKSLFKNLSGISDGAFCENYQRLLAINYFRKFLILDVWQGSEYASEKYY